MSSFWMSALADGAVRATALLGIATGSGMPPQGGN